MANAICIQCGSAKRCSTSVCGKCRLDPRSDVRTLAQSGILSVERFEDASDREHDSRELDDRAARIRAGDPSPFDEAEIQRQVELIELGRSLPWWVGAKAFGMVTLWLAPLWAVIALALWLWLHR